MAFTTMHFAVGMACGGAAATAVCLTLKRGWRWTPLAMTLGGIWAIVPDLPRVFREDFPSLPFAVTLGQRKLEQSLHDIGDIFFFHRALDAQPHEYALHGLAIILVLYNLALAAQLIAIRRRRDPLTAGAASRRSPVRAGAITSAQEQGDDPVVARIRSSHLQRSA